MKTKYVLLLCLFSTVAITPYLPAQPSQVYDLSEPLARGDADIYYIFHSGWLIRTTSHILIFDYSEPMPPPGAARLRESWMLDEELLRDSRVVVFISHAHRDHFSDTMKRFVKQIPGLKAVFGWEYPGNQQSLSMGPDREFAEIDGVKIWNVTHDWDGIPESAFLVEADGVTIYHAGDHSTAREVPLFEENLQYLSKLTESLDLAFTPTWGGEDKMIRALRPSYTLPMHGGGREHEYSAFAERSESRSLPTVIATAARPGQLFRLRNGKLLFDGR